MSVKTAIVGLGRIGKDHARNLRNNPGCDLVAACSVVPEELEWAEKELGITELYSDYNRLLSESGTEAVFLATTTAVHAEQTVKGLKSGRHVFCEKPIGVDLKQSREVAESIKAINSDKVFMLGFVRRFDPAYAFAKKRIDEGAIGKPFMVRSQTADHNDFAAFQLEFAGGSGGTFHDMNVHDIDLARWYLGSDYKSAYALGGSYVHPGFDKIGEADNATVLCEHEDGATSVITACRTAFHGHDTRTEIYGTQGIIRIGFKPAVADVEILDGGGMRTECVYTFFDRFREAFRLEAGAFIDAIVDGKEHSITVNDGVKATEGAELFTRSFKEKRVVQVSEL